MEIGSAGSLRMGKMGEIVHQPEKGIAGFVELHLGVVADAKQLDRVVVDPPFDITISNITQDHLAVDPFPLVRGLVVGEGGDGDLYRDKRGFVVIIIVQPGLERGTGDLLQVSRQETIAVPVEKQNGDQQYSG